MSFIGFLAVCLTEEWQCDPVCDEPLAKKGLVSPASALLRSVITMIADGHSPFPKTQWTVITQTLSDDPEVARAALEKLCLTYRDVIVGWFRRRLSPEEAEEVGQDFIVFLITKALLGKVTARTGHFRMFLVACMRNFLRDFLDKQNAQKRGGGIEKVSLADNDMNAEAAGPDLELDLEFARNIHRRVMERLSIPCELARYIFESGDEGWDEVAARLSRTPTALRQQVSRSRRRHWEEFAREVAETVVPEFRTDDTRHLYELLIRHGPS
jgi:DNA-directed RNA polymerase specialized sigma24 family protein